MLQARDSNGGPPYVPKTIATVGGHPTKHTDIPISAIFLALYVLGAISHMTIFQKNRRRGHKFMMSWAMFGFCMARNLTFILRIVWATQLDNASLIIAAQIFSAAGVLVAYIVVLLLALRIFRATQPELGWNRMLHNGLMVSYFSLFGSLVLVIIFTITSFYTLDKGLKNAGMWVQRASILYMLLFNIASLVLLSLSIFLPPSSNSENFGTGSMRSKIIIVSAGLFFCLFIIGFRFGVAWADPRPISNPAWYQSKEAYYLIQFGLELPLIYGALITRFDRVFWVPNGSCKAGDYSQSEGKELEGRRIVETGESLTDSGESFVALREEGKKVEEA